MAIKLKNRDPKKTDFKPEDIIINTKTGNIFYKNKKDLFKIQGDKVSTPDTTEFLSGSLINGGSF